MAQAPNPHSNDELRAVLDASGVVGAWVHDHWAGRLTLSGDFAGLLGLDPEVAAGGVSIDTFLERTHPEDRSRVESCLHAAGEIGGPVEAEFRTVESAAGVRKLLIRGRVERNAVDGTAQGRGIAIDLTENRSADLRQTERLVNRMAEHAIALRALADGLGEANLTKLIDGLMIEIGFELAKFLQDPRSLGELRAERHH
ncbi:PAS domain-containing protein [Methylobacterium sp. E-041]|uniref:PAS domain-containing protein n=1 Tax=Methylobacterium sp. E-041 TaxID=2836573 RepID=UPI001FBC0213|nr:PAS domain-containing protein [Methylobacterium sp. E-041]MCJ2104518.1 PAS domain-containing protein [Methylobacterium sp. E-041]